MPFHTTTKHKAYGILISFLVIWIAVGCTASTSKQRYENAVAGIRLEKPLTWDVTFSERNGITYLGDEDSTRVQIHGPACDNNSSQYSTPNEEIESNIQRLKLLYNVDEIIVLEEPSMQKIGDNEVTRAVIEIPTFKEGSNAPQRVSVSKISDGDNNSVMVYVFQSKNEALNVQAKEIVESLQLNCPSAS